MAGAAGPCRTALTGFGSSPDLFRRVSGSFSCEGPGEYRGGIPCLSSNIILRPRGFFSVTFLAGVEIELAIMVVISRVRPRSSSSSRRTYI